MDSIKEKAQTSVPPTFPIVRSAYLGFYRAYYPFGNTPAEDFLENCSDISQPSVLVLGCGDLRSCFYTLWKNFDSAISTAPKRFESVTFTLNDYNAAVLARNIIFLHLCLHLPEDITEKKKWLSAMWAIWYCHELYPEHVKILNATLKSLIKYSDSMESWCNKDNPLYRFVHFTSFTSLSEFAHKWRMWQFTTVQTAFMHKCRKQLLTMSINDVYEYCINYSNDRIHIHGEKDEAQAKKANARVPEVKSYLETGSCYAEQVLNLKLKKSQAIVNSTMYEEQNGKYTCHYGLMPFDGYYQTIKFHPASGMACDVTVPSSSFASKPFLANSFQQFVMWVQSSSRILKNKGITIMFNFDCQDAITFCQQQIQRNREKIGHKDAIISIYDFINTSNLMDHVSPSNLVIACVPLLKVDGLLSSTSLASRNCSKTGENFLNLCFGFNSQLFPVILGVRCISYEGQGCSNPVMIKPFLTDSTHIISQNLPSYRTFNWVKVPEVHKLTLSQLPIIEDDNITEALVGMIGSCAYGLLDCYHGESTTILIHNSIETAMGILERFIYLCDKSTSEYSYWEPLCTALKPVLSPYLYCFQTQALLHNIHIHLTISEKDCPICQKKDLTGILGLFCAKIDLASLRPTTPHFLAFIHRCSFEDPKVLLNEAQGGKNVHIFDCFDTVLADGFLRVKFFAPLKFVESQFWVTITAVNKTRLLTVYNDIHLDTLFSETLKSTLIPWSVYDFSYWKLPLKSDLAQTNFLFGNVISHVCDSYKAETKIALSKKISEALSTTKLNIDKISSYEIRLCCYSTTFQLTFSYPIKLPDTVKVEVNSKSKKILIILCKRQPYSLEEERPCFIVSPDHHLSLVISTLNAKTIHSQSLMQMTSNEREFLNTNKVIHSAELKVKVFLQKFFNCAITDSFFCVSFGDSMQCLIVVNKVLYDYQHKTPAIDLAFCFVDKFNQPDMMAKWKSVTHSSDVRQLQLDQAGQEYLRSVFLYFSRRTNGTLLSAGSTSKYADLHKCEFDDAFSRCVLYFLLCDPDVNYAAKMDIFSLFTETFTYPKMCGFCCAYCSKYTFTAKKCARCYEVRYCSKKCQSNHWPKHRKKCAMKVVTKKEVQSVPAMILSLPQCANCRKASSSFMECPQCKTVQYCSQQCLQNHFHEHIFLCCFITEIIDGKKTIYYPQCANCKKVLSSLEECSQCRTVQYCSQQCLQKHSHEHIVLCCFITEVIDGKKAIYVHNNNDSL